LQHIKEYSLSPNLMSDFSQQVSANDIIALENFSDAAATGFKLVDRHEYSNVNAKADFFQNIFSFL
jgi:hypothetical protein